MPDNEDIARRLDIVEEHVRELREGPRTAAVARADAAAARVLAAGAYEDVGNVLAKLEAHTRTLNALRDNQVDLSDHVNAEFAKVHSGIARIVELLTPGTDE